MFQFKTLPLVLVLGLLKVGQFQNEFMKFIVSPKIRTKNFQDFCTNTTGQKSQHYFLHILGEPKIVRISALSSEGRNLNNFLFVFWEKR